MRFTFLGTGTSNGVPVLGCRCEVCRSSDPRDNRRRTSGLLETPSTRVLIDCGPDLRRQLMPVEFRKIDGVLLTRDSCDPLNRRAVRVSMGSVFLVPWTWLEEPVQSLSKYGFKTAAMALSDNSIPLDYPELKTIERLAVIMGTEGDGLPAHVINSADYVVRIPMSHSVDSLNVAAAAAVTFWELRKL